jgi:hypothetical protein
VLFICEGRDEPNLDPKKTLTISIDGRGSVFYSLNGDSRLAKEFNAQLQITVGISFHLSRKKKLPPKAKILVKKLEKMPSAYTESDEEEDRCSIRFQLPPKQTEKVLKDLRALATILDKASIPHRAALFDAPWGDVQGDLDDAGLWIGPAVYVVANWEKQIPHTFELVLNGEESLVDGDSVKFADKK